MFIDYVSNRNCALKNPTNMLMDHEVLFGLSGGIGSLVEHESEKSLFNLNIEQICEEINC